MAAELKFVNENPTPIWDRHAAPGPSVHSATPSVHTSDQTHTCLPAKADQHTCSTFTGTRHRNEQGLKNKEVERKSDS